MIGRKKAHVNRVKICQALTGWGLPCPSARSRIATRKCMALRIQNGLDHAAKWLAYLAGMVGSQKYASLVFIPMSLLGSLKWSTAMRDLTILL